MQPLWLQFACNGASRQRTSPQNICGRTAFEDAHGSCQQRRSTERFVYWMDPGSNDCQPKWERRVDTGAVVVLSVRSLLLSELLLLLLSLFALCEVPSCARPSASPPLLLLSRALLACEESTSRVSVLVAMAVPMLAMHRVHPISQEVARMVICPWDDKREA